MAYRNFNTNTALRDIRGMVRDMPIDAARRDYQRALGQAAETKSMLQAKDYELGLPAKQLAQREAQDAITRQDSPFNLKSVLSQVAPDQAMLLLQDQKNGMPPAMSQFEQNLAQMPGGGFKMMPDGSIVDAKGNPLSQRQAGPVMHELNRTLMLNMDPVKAREYRVKMLDDALNRKGLSPEESAKIKANRDKLANMSEGDLWQNYSSILQRVAEQDAYYGRPGGKLLGPRIAEAQNRLAAISKAEIEKQKQDFQLEKLRREYGYKAGIESMKQRGANERAAAKGSGGSDAPSFYDKEDYKRMGGALEEIDAALNTGGRVHPIDGTIIPFSPAEVAQLKNRRVELIRGMAKKTGEAEPPYINYNDDGSVDLEALPEGVKPGDVIEFDGMKFKVEAPPEEVPETVVKKTDDVVENLERIVSENKALKEAERKKRNKKLEEQPMFQMGF